MKTMKKWRMAVLSLCMMLTLFAACSGGQHALVGKWRRENGYTVEFTADGKAYTQGTEYADFSIEGDTIVFSNIFGNSDDREIYEFKLNGDTLEMTANGETVVCQRVK